MQNEASKEDIIDTHHIFLNAGSGWIVAVMMDDFCHLNPNAHCVIIR